MQLKNPKWVENILEQSNRSIESRIPELNTRLRELTSENPAVSVVIPAKNEQETIVNCLDSISRNQFADGIELIVVDNNSTDRTPELLKRIEVVHFDQEQSGIGWARQLGLEQAKGEYVLTADADCLYHEDWIETMLKALRGQEVVCVYGIYRFIGDHINGRLKLQSYELFRNLIVMIRGIRHSYLNARGGCMGYLRSAALTKGYDTRNLRGEDGRLCYDLMELGKVQAAKGEGASVWTTVKAQGNASKSWSGGIIQNLYRELSRSVKYFQRPKTHDTKTSENTPDSMDEVLRNWKKK